MRLSGIVIGMVLLSAVTAFAGSDSLVVDGGDLRINGTGNGLVFSDGTIQATAAPSNMKSVATCADAGAKSNSDCTCAKTTLSKVYSGPGTGLKCTATSETGSCTAVSTSFTDAFGTTYYHGACCVCTN